jgi:signal transduction histidine kinase
MRRREAAGPQRHGGAGWTGRPGGAWAERHARWHQRARRRLSHSLKARLVALFLLLALFMTGAFLFGMQKALSTGWRDAARPLLTDYVERLTQEIGSPPSVERAQALVQRLPITVRISGPQINWRSHDEDARAWGPRGDDDWHRDEPRLLVRTTADGHRIEFGINHQPWRDKPRLVGWITLVVLLVLTALAYKFVRRLLRPLDDIHAGAQRYGKGDFTQPIPVRRKDELGELATGINAMAHELHQMLEAKRALLLAISHELRSPLTRARLNTELLPETAELASMRQALLRDLGEMRDLVTDLLESERLGRGHAALQLEPTDLGALAQEVAQDVAVAMPSGREVQCQIEPGLPPLPLDRARMRLLLRNLLDNALRHSTEAAAAPELHLARPGAGIVELRVRDHGPGVDDAVLPHLAEPFYRADAARQRATGGVGLGLYLCKLVAQAHGGEFSVRNAQPGLEVRVRLPAGRVVVAAA